MEFRLTTMINATPSGIYNAWLSSEGHAAMTGGEASASHEVGARFTAWDGYIWGKNLVLEPNQRIVQSWRTTEFESGDEDSRIEIVLNGVDGQTELTLHHSNLPEHGSQYKKGWDDHYFQPMKRYFTK